MKKIISFLFVITALQSFADNPKTDVKKFPFNYGKMQDTVYTNPFFGFSIAVPSTWIIQNKTQIDYVVSKGKNIVEFKDETTNKAIEKLDISSMTLLMTYKYEMGSPVNFNPGIIIMADDVSMYPGVKKGSDYLFQVKKQFQNSNANYSMAPYYDSLNVANATFDILDCHKEDSNIHLDYFCTIQKRYAFFIIISYSNNDEKNELLNYVKTSQFQK